MLFVSTMYNHQQIICYSLQTMQIVHDTLIISKNYFAYQKKKALNLTLMTVIIYTDNKVKSNRGREENCLLGFFLFASNQYQSLRVQFWRSNQQYRHRHNTR